MCSHVSISSSLSPPPRVLSRDGGAGQSSARSASAWRGSVGRCESTDTPPVDDGQRRSRPAIGRQAESPTPGYCRPVGVAKAAWTWPNAHSHTFGCQRTHRHRTRPDGGSARRAAWGGHGRACAPTYAHARNHVTLSAGTFRRRCV